jgi:glycine/D-amino acid oxidase-like deaminating enzyme
MSSSRVAVIGGGSIGSSLAFDCALKGQNVVVARVGWAGSICPRLDETIIAIK